MNNERKCGKCSACCFTHEVLEVEKPVYSWCQHCEQGQGCRIYGDKPSSCNSFRCDWLKGIGREEDRPDRAGVMRDSVAEGSSLGGIVQLWEVIPGKLDLDNPSTIWGIGDILSQGVFVGCRLCSGRIILFSPPKAKLSKKIRSAIRRDVTKFISHDEFIRLCRRIFALENKKGRPG